MHWCESPSIKGNYFVSPTLYSTVFWGIFFHFLCSHEKEVAWTFLASEVIFVIVLTLFFFYFSIFYFMGESNEIRITLTINCKTFFASACLHDLDLSYYTLLWQWTVLNINLRHANNIVMSSKFKLDMQERISFFFQSSEIMQPFALTF